jgi:hypothetical protein
MVGNTLMLWWLCFSYPGLPRALAALPRQRGYPFCTAMRKPQRRWWTLTNKTQWDQRHDIQRRIHYSNVSDPSFQHDHKYPLSSATDRFHKILCFHPRPRQLRNNSTNKSARHAAGTGTEKATSSPPKGIAISQVNSIDIHIRWSRCSEFQWQKKNTFLQLEKPAGHSYYSSPCSNPSNIIFFHFPTWIQKHFLNYLLARQT